MNKKVVMSKTKLFIFIIAFIIIFKGIFGEENTLVGVTTITAMLMFLPRDLTLSPVKNTLKFIGINLVMGIATFICSQNMWLAIPINFIFIFGLGYIFMYTLKQPAYMPFILQYLFLLATPIKLEQLPMRLGALAFAGIAIMLMQLLSNKGRITKTGDKVLKQIVYKLIQKAELVKNNQDTSLVDNEIKIAIGTVRKMVYDQREFDFYLTEEASIKLNLSAILENLDLLLKEIKDKEDNTVVLEDTILCLKQIEKGFSNLEDITSYKVSFENMLNKYQDNDNITSLKIFITIGFLEEAIGELRSLDKKRYTAINKTDDIPTYYKQSILDIKRLRQHSFKFAVAMRMAIALTLGAFLVDFFHIPEGRWILFTLLSVTIPIYEMAHQKMRDRIFGTVIGAVVVFVLFSIFKSIGMRTAIMMLAGYFSSYIKEYRYSIITVTVSAIGAVALTSGMTISLTILRITMVLIGVGLACLVNKFIFPYKLEESNENLEKFYEETIYDMLREIDNAVEGNYNVHHIKNLFLRTTMIEERLYLNNQAMKEHTLTEKMKNKRGLVTNIYELYLWIKNNEIQNEDHNCISESLKELIKQEQISKQQLIEKITKQIPTLKSIKEKVLLSLIMEIATEIK